MNKESESIEKNALYKEHLQQGIEELGLAVCNTSVEKLLIYLSELHKWNQVYNLSGIKKIEDHIYRNILDCLAVLPYINENRMVDVGTGAGLPGLLLAIVRPEQEWLLVDANGKKTRFLNQIKHKLTLDNVVIENQRIEMLSLEKFSKLGNFQGLCSRAFDNIPDSLRLCRPQLKPGMHFYALKGKVQQQEVDALPEWARLKEIIPLRVPKLEEQRHLIIISIEERKQKLE